MLAHSRRDGCSGSSQPGSLYYPDSLPFASFDLSQFQGAWENVTHLAPIVRTRIVDTKVVIGDIAAEYDHVFSQVICNGQVPWTEYSNLDQCLQAERGNEMGLGEPLMRLGIVGNTEVQEQEISPPRQS